MQIFMLNLFQLAVLCDRWNTSGISSDLCIMYYAGFDKSVSMPRRTVHTINQSVNQSNKIV